MKKEIIIYPLVILSGLILSFLSMISSFKHMGNLFILCYFFIIIIIPLIVSYFVFKKNNSFIKNMLISVGITELIYYFGYITFGLIDNIFKHPGTFMDYIIWSVIFIFLAMLPSLFTAFAISYVYGKILESKN